MNTTTLALAFVIFCAACNASPEAESPLSESASPSPIVGEWNVELIEGSEVTDAGIAFLGFGSDGRVYGNASVNRLLGSWQVKSAELHLSQLGSTRMAGPPELMQQEARLLTALSHVVHAERSEDGRLTLRSSDGTALVVASPRSE